MGSRLAMAVLIVLTGASANWPVRAEEAGLSERERLLLERIQQLEARLEQVERQLASQAAPTAAAVPQQPPAQPSRPQEALDGIWKGGLRFTSEDKRFDLRVGGRAVLDWFATREDDEVRARIGRLEEGVEWRSARLGMEGTIYENTFFKAEYDFAPNSPEWRDVFFGYKGLPVEWRFGHLKEPFSLEELTPVPFMTFMERGLPNALVPSRNMGLMLSDTLLDQRMTWAAGVFLDADNFGDNATTEAFDDFHLTGRVTGLPWRQDETHLLHLGAAYSYQSIDNPAYRYRTLPETRMEHIGRDSEGNVAVRRTIDTGPMAVDDAHLFGLETALVYGPWSVQSEAMFADVGAQTNRGRDADFYGWYVLGSYFLTGESRAYNPVTAAFDRVRPRRNLGHDGGWGAWELAARYSRLDLDESGLPASAGTLDNITLGLNWYFNPHLRLMLNYVHSMVDRDDVDGDADIVQLRMNVGF